MEAIQWKWKIVAAPEQAPQFSERESDLGELEGAKCKVLELVDAPFYAIEEFGLEDHQKQYLLTDIHNLKEMRRSTVDGMSGLASAISQSTVPDDIFTKGLQTLRETLLTDVLPKYFVDRAQFKPDEDSHQVFALRQNENLARVVDEYNTWRMGVSGSTKFGGEHAFTFEPLVVPRQSPASKLEVEQLLKCLAKMVAARSLWPLAQLINEAGRLNDPSMQSDKYRHDMGILGLFDYSERVRGSNQHQQQYIDICMRWLKGESELPASELLMMAKFLRNDILNCKQPRSRCRIEHDSPFSVFGSWIYLTFYTAEFFITSPKHQSTHHRGILVNMNNAFFQEAVRLTARPCPFCFRPTDPNADFFKRFGPEFNSHNWDVWLRECRNVSEVYPEQSDFWDMYAARTPLGNQGCCSLYNGNEPPPEEEEEEDEDDDDDQPAEEGYLVNIRNDFHQTSMYGGEGCDYLKPVFAQMLTHISAAKPTDEQIDNFANNQQRIDSTV